VCRRAGTRHATDGPWRSTPCYLTLDAQTHTVARSRMNARIRTAPGCPRAPAGMRSRARWLGASRAEAGSAGRSPAAGLGPGRHRAPCRGPRGPAPLPAAARHTGGAWPPWRSSPGERAIWHAQPQVAPPTRDRSPRRLPAFFSGIRN
jgi:hypothetical protein